MLVAAMAGACATEANAPGSAPGVGGAAGNSAQGGSGGFSLDGSFLDVSLDGQLDAPCGAISEKATATPLNLYIILDKSSTMLGDKWNAARAGLELFLNDAKSSGIKVAINFFPRDPDSTPACDANAYKEPKVGFAALPGNAAPILAAMDAESPNGTSTPIYPALGGAIAKGIEVRSNQPGDSAAVLLVTDGEPQGPAPLCGGVDPQDPQVIAELAAVGQQNNIITFVVGLPGASQSTVNQIAAAGGSTSAIVVGTTNTQADFQAALAAVRGKALPCEYELPTKVAGGEVLPTNVNVLFTPSGGDGQTIPRDDQCVDGLGWHYDDPANPKRIILCAGTCDQFKQDFNGQVDILLGCKTIVK